MATEKFFALEEVAKNTGKDGTRVWIIIKNSVYDPTDYLEDHPGGGDLITEWAGKDATKAFNEFGHSSDALKDLKKLKIGELREEDRKDGNKKNKKDTKNTAEPKIEIKISTPPEKTPTRSCINIITCGLCG